MREGQLRGLKLTALRARALVEELDERMKKLTHKLENARRDMVRGAASEVYAVYDTSPPA